MTVGEIEIKEIEKWPFLEHCKLYRNKALNMAYLTSGGKEKCTPEKCKNCGWRKNEKT